MSVLLSGKFRRQQGEEGMPRGEVGIDVERQDGNIVVEVLRPVDGRFPRLIFYHGTYFCFPTDATDAADATDKRSTPMFQTFLGEIVILIDTYSATAEDCLLLSRTELTNLRKKRYQPETWPETRKKHVA